MNEIEYEYEEFYLSKEAIEKLEILARYNLMDTDDYIEVMINKAYFITEEYLREDEKYKEK